MKVKTLKSIEQFKTIEASDDKSVFVFSAGWCPDCRFIEPFMPEIEEKYHNIMFYHVDRDDFIDLCAAQDVYGIPSFIAYQKGEEIGRFVSKDRKTKEEIEAFIESLQ